MNTLFRISLGLSISLVLFSSSCKKDKTATKIITHDTIYEGKLVDRQGTEYKTVTLGTQTWMAENLQTTVYSDSTAIPNITNSTVWMSLSTAAYNSYNNNDSLGHSYGRLYNWYAVETGKLCPNGWHVPTDAEWDTLVIYLVNQRYDYLDYGTVAVAQAMALNAGWSTSTTAGAPGYNNTLNNSCKFSAKPCGYSNGYFHGLGLNAYFWSSTPDTNNTVNASDLYICNELTNPQELKITKKMGLSIRCLKD